ncbi:hypothetical protein P7K49_032242 [Saguinus oedipus]|uniref:Uncharacterized protein n=1 Tax=Saguinus oedipus TaxID=9490 RepID=A0ABQ9TXP9_SAGOE|nr:hypothetical protein P7K49_032242 [Saguinus oedipus]
MAWESSWCCHQSDSQCGSTNEETSARGKKRQIGWFPANYVKLLSPGTSKITPTEPPKSTALAADKIETWQPSRETKGWANCDEPQSPLGLFA